MNSLYSTRILGRATVILLALSLGLFGTLPQKVSAQTPPPADLKFLCAQVVQETRSARCALYVPANVVGASFEIEIPKGKFSSFQNLKKGDLIPPSGLFFQLEAPDVGGSLLLRVNYADLKAQPFVSQPYALLLFDIVLSSVENTSFPLVIDTSFRANGQLYTAEAVALNQPSFKALTNVPLQMQISGAQESAPISSSFHFAGDEQTVPTVSSAPTSKCFDDPVSSMTEREWSLVCEAKSKGIISGNASGNLTFFLPNQAVNRAEAMKIVTLGILRSLGKVSEREVVNEERSIKATAPMNTFITYPDIRFENGEPPWFAVFVNIASQYGIVQGYPQDGTFRAGNTINNAESYRVIVETGRVASEAIGKALDDSTQKTSLKTEEWFLKYANTLDTYNIPFSREYEKFTTRKEFLIMVMDLLKAVGLS